jgi:hypothetical protein
VDQIAVELVSMVIECAWCKKILGKKAPLKDVSVTHSICESCMKKATKKNPPGSAWRITVGTARSPEELQRTVGSLGQVIQTDGSGWYVSERMVGEKSWRPLAEASTLIEAQARAALSASDYVLRHNPGEAWHAEQEREAEASEKKVKKASLKDFYHGKAIAHFESGLKARALKGESRNFVRRNPIAVFGLGNPPDRVNTKIAGIVYNRCLEVRAEKTGTFSRGLWKHPFAKSSQVQILALDNGDLLLHSTVGIRLWKKA